MAFGFGAGSQGLFLFLVVSRDCLMTAHACLEFGAFFLVDHLIVRINAFILGIDIVMAAGSGTGAVIFLAVNEVVTIHALLFFVRAVVEDDLLFASLVHFESVGGSLRLLRDRYRQRQARHHTKDAKNQQFFHDVNISLHTVTVHTGMSCCILSGTQSVKTAAHQYPYTVILEQINVAT
jgi:hypothetical protein